MGKILLIEGFIPGAIFQTYLPVNTTASLSFRLSVILSPELVILQPNIIAFFPFTSFHALIHLVLVSAMGALCHEVRPLQHIDGACSWACAWMGGNL